MMTSISVCNGECDHKTKCYRYVKYHEGRLNPHWQSYCGCYYDGDDKVCANFLPLPENIPEIIEE